MGIQVPESQNLPFRQFLADLHMDYVEEERNAAYDLFLK